MLEAEEKQEAVGDRDKLLSCFKSDCSLMKAIEQLPPELFLRDEAELAKELRPTPLDYALKKQIWTKFYENEQNGIYSIKMIEVYGGLCTSAYFFQTLLKHPVRIAWLITPPVNTAALIEEAFIFAFQKVRDGILNMPVTEKSAPTLLKAFQYFADRHLGPMVHKIESKNLNVDVNGDKMTTPTDPREIEAKLREIKAKLIPSRDVTPSDG